MNTNTFNATLGTLTALPADIIERAHRLTESLTDVKRKELMDELTEGNAVLQTLSESINAVTKGFEELLERTERAMRGLTRDEREEEEHEKDLQSIEEQLTTPPLQQ
ncbi:hypothetical protein COU80_00285 [Candidatus Peregrinibacteria bacterium CG10_big_fil_rev_8_21_14_0_10_55_24]|nr:MAG: hypothetical protein COU80_00285 [Candidatus Peregrinibacteria bacterium CG10_big_fil_rev_8_21_14_0_10_55_24]